MRLSSVSIIILALGVIIYSARPEIQRAAENDQRRDEQKAREAEQKAQGVEPPVPAELQRQRSNRASMANQVKSACSLCCAGQWRDALFTTDANRTPEDRRAKKRYAILFNSYKSKYCEFALTAAALIQPPPLQIGMKCSRLRVA